MLFHRSPENRPTNLDRHKRLIKSMKQYGFISTFPIVCVRDDAGRLIVKDGQHRLMVAQSLGLAVWYVVADVDFDPAVISSAAYVWVPRDHALKFAASGLSAYQEGLDFAQAHGLPLTTAFMLLAGVTCFSNIASSFYEGTFKIKDRAWADAVAGIYAPLVGMAPKLRNARFIEACMAVCRVEDFDSKRLLQGAERCREKLVPYSTRDAYLEMVEAIYNFGRSKLVPLKNLAVMAMRSRSATHNEKIRKIGREKGNATQKARRASRQAQLGATA